MKNILVFLLIWLLSTPSWAEVLILKSGHTVEGPITEQKEDSIRIDFYGMPMTYFYDQITSIDGLSPQEFQNTEKNSPSQADIEFQPVRPDDTSSITHLELLEKLKQSVLIIRVFRENKPFLLGTGFILSDDGLIATNFHLVFEANTVEIETVDGKVYPVEHIANYDHALDACILKAPQTGQPALRLGDSDMLTKHQAAFSIGHPGGRGISDSSRHFRGSYENG
jgi:S1-C subfamily serine protease